MKGLGRTSLVAIVFLAGGAAAQSTIGIGETLYEVGGFDGPEAVRYDPLQDVYFVSNFVGSASGDANAFVSKVSANGRIIDRTFMTGSDETPFHGGRGMYIDGRHLWVCDADGVHLFNRFSGLHADFIDFTAFEPGFLNDIVILDNGDAYITDTGTERLFRVRDGEITVAAETPFAANGVALDAEANELLLVPWEGGDYVATWGPGNGFGSRGSFSGGGNFDGIEIVDGQLIVASQGDDSLHLMVQGEDRKARDLPGSPADIAVDTKRRRVAVPYVGLDRVDIIELQDQ